jgi:adenylate cyclase class 2
MIEAELKARVRDPERVRELLAARAAEHSSVYHDTYYDRPDHALTDAGRELRVRVMEQEGRRRCLLTFKDAAVDEPSGSKPEHETEIGEAATVDVILRALGSEPVIAFTKQCANFTFDTDGRQVLATLVQVPELDGTWLEVETLVEDQTDLPARLAGRACPGRRLRPTQCRGGQRAVDLSAAGRLPGRGDRPRCGDRDGQDRPAPRWVCLQAAPLDPDTQGAGPAGVGKKRLRVEALLTAAASPAPPPACDLIPDPTLADELFPEDLPRLLGLLGRADLYLQDEVEVALHPP